MLLSRAITIRPLVSRSSRCTMRAPATSAATRTAMQSAFSGPIPGTERMPHDLSMMTSASSICTMRNPRSRCASVPTMFGSSVTHPIIAMNPLAVIAFSSLFLQFVPSVACAQAPAPAPAEGPVKATPTTEDPSVWSESERGHLTRQTQLTFPDRFIKAGEAYFSPSGKEIIFQAVEQPAEGATADDFYAMFVAAIGSDASGKSILSNIRRVSPPHSANTCGWFDASRTNTVIFGSTLVAPQSTDAPGYQRATGRYKWQFPPEMRVVEVDLIEAGSIASGTMTPKVLVGDGSAYTAECTTTRDGRNLLHCTLVSGQGDIMVMDLKSGLTAPLVQIPGYDGGPFFSPDEKQICYRSDRNGDSLLQVYVSDIVRNDAGAIVGTSNERQLTANEYVNWAPYWHPNGKKLVYASSEVGHSNYEIFSVVLPTTGMTEVPRRERVTQAEGADVLPVFDTTGRRMMWTSQRGAGRSSQLWIADVVAPTGPVAPVAQSTVK